MPCRSRINGSLGRLASSATTRRGEARTAAIAPLRPPNIARRGMARCENDGSIGFLRADSRLIIERSFRVRVEPSVRDGTHGRNPNTDESRWNGARILQNLTHKSVSGAGVKRRLETIV